MTKAAKDAVEEILGKTKQPRKGKAVFNGSVESVDLSKGIGARSA
jgi:hypothetical protein